MRPPTRPLRVDHLGYYTRNARETVQFWTEVMRCKFTSSIWNPELPSTRQPYPYLHIFFELGDGSTVAFFEISDVGEETPLAEPLRTGESHGDTSRLGRGCVLLERVVGSKGHFCLTKMRKPRNRFSIIGKRGGMKQPPRA